MAAAAASCNSAHSESPAAPDKLPVFLMHAIYQVASILSRITQDTPDGGTKDKIEALKQLLRLVNPRWRVAGNQTLNDTVLICPYCGKANRSLRRLSEHSRGPRNHHVVGKYQDAV